MVFSKFADSSDFRKNGVRTKSYTYLMDSAQYCSQNESEDFLFFNDDNFNPLDVTSLLKLVSKIEQTLDYDMDQCKAEITLSSSINKLRYYFIE
jgi:hypothetical protein